MSWRTVVVSRRSKLDLKMGYMVIRGEEERRIFLDEIAVLMIENPAVSLTGCLLEALTKKKIRVIFCDSRRSPMAELVPLHGSHDTTRKLRQQMTWSEEIKGAVWREIVADKIAKQAQLLAERKKQKESLLLESYIPQIEFQDSTNREGHAAKVYFNALFGMDFSRRDEHPFNAALNYGYSILLSAFNREITAAGYLTELGIHHDNVFNHFNLSSDLMEPFARLETAAVNETNYLHTASLIGELEQYIQELSFELPCDIICNKMSIGSVLRAVGIEIPDDYDNDLERLLDYMELTRELERDKLFLFVNLRSWYSDEEVSKFLISILSHEYHVLLVDSVSKARLPDEARITIDTDLCEF